MTDQGKVWLVTGATSGFGQALAEAVLERGDRAVLTGRRAERLEALAAGFGNRALCVAADLTRPADRDRLVESAIARFGAIDVLANIAGRGSVGAVEEFTLDELRAQMEVNFFAVVALTQAALPQMRARRSGHILNLTSIGGLISLGGFGAYCASKFALEAWSEALRDEVAPLGLRVTLVEPGNFRTEFAGDVNMRPAHPLDDYRGVIGPVEDFLYGQAGRQAGDPAKAATLVIETVERDAPPLRLMMGKDAYEVWDRTIARRNAELAAGRARGEDTAFDDAQVIPIGAG